MKSIAINLMILFFGLHAFAGTGIIQGKVTDERGDALIGATVMIEGTSLGAKTDLDGKFVIRNVDDGTYSLVFTYVSYEKKTLSEVVVKNGSSDLITVVLLRTGKGLKEVVVKTQVKKESINALQLQQKNLATISDGISAELIKKTPDRNTGDVLKRVSGVSIAENKFAVIRGLADRYNLAMLNGDILPSSEADRKAFSFDIFPANLLDNIIIVKAATPDRPAEFAGGIIDLSTKDIPTENFLTLQLGTGMNTISTFKPYYDSKNSSTDFLGIDKSMRVIPEGFPSKETLNQSLSQYTLDQRVEASKKFENTWGTKKYASQTPFRNLQLSGGYVKRFGKNNTLGIVGAISYSRNLRTYYTDRNEVNGNTEAYRFIDTVSRDNVLVGSILNLGVKLGAKHKINLKNSYTINSEDQTVRRSGDFMDNEYYIKGSALWFTSNRLLSNQLSSEHSIGKRNMKLQLGVGRNQIARSIPDLRRSYYTKNYDAVQDVYTANVTTFPNPFFMGRFFASTKEEIYNANADLSIPYQLFQKSQSLKTGVYYQSKQRNYEARVLAYVKAKTAGFDQTLLTQDESTMFDQQNIRSNGFILSDATQPQDRYEANSALAAGYIMSDNQMGKFRAVWGARIESFQQTLTTGVLKPGDLEIKKENTNVLPSVNLTYLMNKKTNIRLCASQTLSRPEFRELSPSSFYDYNLSATYTGNPDLKQTSIQNVDLRYEYFMGKGEMVSASVFYKHFTNPIETTVPFGLTTTQKVFSYVNVPQAMSYGAEIEFRKSLGFLTDKKKSFLHNIVLFGNLAYIRSEVEVTTKTSGGEDIKYLRPMQGQSPYIINGGMAVQDPGTNLGATLVFNRIGQRIFAVGNGEIPELYEAPRNVLDFSVSKKLFKKWEVKLTVSDILSNRQIFYYNLDDKLKIEQDNPGYQKKSDYTVIRTRVGTNIGLSVSYQF